MCNFSIDEADEIQKQARELAIEDMERHRSQIELLSSHFQSKKREYVLSRFVKRAFSKNMRYMIGLRHKKKYWVNDHYVSRRNFPFISVVSKFHPYYRLKKRSKKRKLELDF